jgi:hypothetical protein
MFYVMENNELDDTVENSSPTRTCSSTDCIRKSNKRKERRGILENEIRNMRGYIK